MSLNSCTPSQVSSTSTAQCSSLGGRCTCSQCGGGTSSLDMDNMTGTFIDLAKCRHPAGCYCSECTALQQFSENDLLGSMSSLHSQLPVPSKVVGWLVPGKPCSPPIVTREVALAGEQVFTVGREQQCNLVMEEFMFNSIDENLQCNKTSRVQFEISIENDRPFISDRSMNGTFVNGSKLIKGVSRRLNHGDVISLLQVELEMFCYLDEFQMMNRNYPLRIITKYLVGNIVGSGSYSIVRKGLTRNTFTPVAMKFIRKNQLPNWLGWLVGNDDAVRSEVDILQQLHHPCITKVLDVVETTFELVIVMEFAEGGELERQVKVDSIMGRLSESTAKFQFYQICHTIAYLHSKNICHRDLKLANILLMEPDPLSRLKVSDFGVSKIWSSTNVLESMVGTPAFMSPEVLALESAPHLSYTCKSDCWSLGVVLYVLLSGQQPFNCQQFMGPSVHMQIMSGAYLPMVGEQWNRVSSHAKDLVSRLLVVSPDTRLGAAQILQHHWFAEDDATCSQARNRMFGTEDSVGGSVTSESVPTSDGEMVRKEGSKEEVAASWREPEANVSDGEEVVDDIRARLRPRVKRGDDAVPGTPTRLGRIPGKVSKPKVGTPIKGTLTLLKGIKRKEEEDVKQVAFLLPEKRRRRNSEVGKQQPLVIEVGVNKKGKREKRRRRRRTTGI